MSKHYLLALYNDAEDAEAAITELQAVDIKNFNAKDDLLIQSPVGLLEDEELLGEKNLYTCSGIRC
jgi:hypothetical protein